MNLQNNFLNNLKSFNEFGKTTFIDLFSLDNNFSVNRYINEFWTSKQRAAHSLHEISYRACFKPQLPRFFIDRLTADGDLVYDPFMGRGTTILEAHLSNRVFIGCDVNPLSVILIEPRLNPPLLSQIKDRLAQLNLNTSDNDFPEELLVFYHIETLKEICALKKYFHNRENNNELDYIDQWLRMVAVNRLTGHSNGFFSVYTLPPNQATSVKAQKKINEKRNQVPEKRDIKKIILKKSKSLLRDVNSNIIFDFENKKSSINAFSADKKECLITRSAHHTPEIKSNSVKLVVTSPPFLDVVNYSGDNWLRGWFCGIDTKQLDITILKKLDDWKSYMQQVFKELYRILSTDGYIAFEVGEVKKGKINLDEIIVEIGLNVGLTPVGIMVNSQNFTKTAQCWGIDNSSKGTNTNRIVIFRKI